MLEPAVITLQSIDGVSGGATSTIQDEGNIVYHLSSNTSRDLTVSYILDGDNATTYTTKIAGTVTGGVGTISVAVDEHHGEQTHSVTIIDVSTYDPSPSNSNHVGSSLEGFTLVGSGVTLNSKLPTFTIYDDSYSESVNLTITGTDGLLPGAAKAADDGDLVYHLSTGDLTSHLIVGYSVSGDPNSYLEEITNGVGTITVPIGEQHGQQTPTVTITDLYQYSATAPYNIGVRLEGLTITGCANNPVDGSVDLPTYAIEDDSGYENIDAVAGGHPATFTSGVLDVFTYTNLLVTPDTIHNFSVADGDHLDLSHILTSVDNIQSMISIDAMESNGKADSNSLISVNIGGQVYQMASLAGVELGIPDVLANANSGASLNTALHGAAWTDVVDITSAVGTGSPSEVTALNGASLNNGYTGSGGDWTVVIKSGTATVDLANHQITFSTDHAGNEVQITTHDNVTHDIANVDKIQWHG
jgi:hypothetical protein